MIDGLKYPRRKSRTIGGKKYNINKPTEESSKKLKSVKSKNTKIEIILKKALRKANIKYRTMNKLHGKPDIKLFGYKVVIFCDGDFWHGFNYKKMKIKNNKEFWKGKIKRNIDRDKEVTSFYKRKGFKVFRFWEHQIKTDVDKCIKIIVNDLELYNKNDN